MESWLLEVLRPIRTSGGKLERALNLGVLLSPGLALLFQDFRNWAFANWRWAWLGLIGLVLLFAISSWRQFKVLHPILDIRIRVEHAAETERLDLWVSYRVITLPFVCIGEHSSHSSMSD